MDAGISGLVSAISTFPSLETIESCEGHNGNAAWISFRYGAYWENPWRELADFVLAYLVPKLASLVGDDATLKIQGTPSGQIFGELSVRPGAALRVETALRQLARDFSVRLRHTERLRDVAGYHRPEFSTDFPQPSGKIVLDTVTGVVYY